MNALNYLFFTKIKGSIRNIFRKPLSAILTIAALLFFGFILFISITSDSISLITNINSVESMIMMLLGYIAFMLGIMLFQKRTALVRTNDASFIFAGPFTRRQILTYISIDNMKGSSLYAIASALYVIMMMSDIGLTLPFVLFLIFMTIVLFYIIFAFITWLYLLEITSPNVRSTKLILLALMIVIIALLFGKNLYSTQFNIELAFQQFLHDPTFFIIPLFGWMKWAIMSLATKDYINALIATGLMSLSAIGVSLLILNVKGDFYEKAIQDATWYSEIRKNAKEGKQNNPNLTIKNVENTKFLDGPKAILSKNMLELRKTKSWIRKQDLFLMIFYLFLAKMMGMDFTFFQYYILIVLAMSVNTDFVINELKKHFIYLIPAKPIVKLIYLLLPVIGRLIALIVIALVPAWFVYQVDFLTFLIAIINLFGYALIFVGSNVWSLKIMKSRNNVLVEQLLKLIVIIVAIIPAIAVTVLIILLVPMNETQLLATASISSLVVNILVGLAFILNAKSMLNGTSLMAD